MASATPALHQLVGGYTNQDLYDFYPDVDAAVAAFLAESTHVRAFPGEVERVLAELDDRALTTLLVDDLGVGFIAEAVNGGYRGWLLHVAEQCRAATAAEG